MGWENLSYQSRYTLLFGGIPFLLMIFSIFLMFLAGESGAGAAMFALLFFGLTILGTIFGFIYGLVRDNKNQKNKLNVGVWIIVGLILLAIIGWILIRFLFA
tara:strand:+ start:257 stop:562 length:306 start_codon:yes stop_codon:yes gene_type:complete